MALWRTSNHKHTSSCYFMKPKNNHFVGPPYQFSASCSRLLQPPLTQTPAQRGLSDSSRCLYLLRGRRIQAPEQAAHLFLSGRNRGGQVLVSTDSGSPCVPCATCACQYMRG